MVHFKWRLDNNAARHRGYINRECERSHWVIQCNNSQNNTTEMRLQSASVLVLLLLQAHTDMRSFKILFKARLHQSLFIFIRALCRYPSATFQLNSLSIPISFSLLTTHCALYLEWPGRVKTQRFIKTILMNFGQQWPKPSRPFALMHCSLSHLETSPWRSRSFPWPPVSAIEAVRL